MSLKLKALGLGLLAVLAMSATAVMNASAETGGHFVWSNDALDHVLVEGNETAQDKTEFTVPGLTGLVCDEVTYSGTAVAANTTVTSLTVTPSYKKCKTTGGAAGQIVVDMNGCDYVFTIGKEATPTTNTVDVVCPPNVKIQITHTGNGCRVEVPTVSNLKGVGYHTILENNKHAITVSVDVPNIPATVEPGICAFAVGGTSKLGTMEGAAIVTGFDTNAIQVPITATGSVS